METVSLGSTSEGFGVFMDRNAFDAESILVINRVKPHTDFSGTHRKRTSRDDRDRPGQS
jgi:hypothetical protein